jgi:hypothetical protein
VRSIVKESNRKLCHKKAGVPAIRLWFRFWQSYYMKIKSDNNLIKLRLLIKKYHAGSGGAAGRNPYLFQELSGKKSYVKGLF